MFGLNRQLSHNHLQKVFYVYLLIICTLNYEFIWEVSYLH